MLASTLIFISAKNRIDHDFLRYEQSKCVTSLFGATLYFQAGVRLEISKIRVF